jgi:hypothetical protein
MDIQEIEKIETEEGVKFSLNDATGRIVTSGSEAAVDRALVRIALFRDELGEALRLRQGLPKPAERIVTREVSTNVPSKEVLRANYVRWFSAQPKYYWPTEQELDLMFAQVNEGDEVIPDFAHSFCVRRPNGLLVSVDRKGRVSQPSPYSPAVQK